MSPRSLWDRLLKQLLPNPPWYQFWRLQRFQHVRRHLAGMILLILTLAFTSLWLAALQVSLNFSYQADSPKNVPLLVEMELDQAQNTARITRANRLNTYTPLNRLKMNTATTHTLKQIKNQKITETQPITILDTVMGENFDTLMKKGNPSQDPIFRPDKPKIITTIFYNPGSSLVLSTPKQASVPVTNLTILAETVNQTPLVKNIEDDSNAPTQSKTPHLNLAFISNGYTDKNQFKSDATKMYSFLLTLAPFSSYSQSIKRHFIYNQTDLKCNRPEYMPRLITCDIYSMFQALGDRRYDSYIIIDNSDEYGGAGYLGANIAVTYRNVDALAKEVMVHEFGHSFGSLMDEYSYGASYSGYPYWPNCDYSPCPKWNSRSDSGCFETCGYTNLARPTYNSSLMRSLFPDGGFRFGPISEEHLETLLSSYTKP